MTAHTCHWPGCKVHVPPRLWGCAPHWAMLPWHLRKAIWDAYVPGQEITKTPSAAYIETAYRVEAWILANYKPVPPPPQGDLFA